MRPWTHLVNRLNDRTQELHDTLNAPSEEDLAHAQEETQRTLSAALQRIAALERECRDLREAVERAEQLREVCDDLSEILGDVERATKRNERKADTVRSAIGARIAAVELGLVHLERRRQEDMAAIEATGFRFPGKSVLFAQAREYAWLLAQKVLSYLRTLLWVLGAKDPFATKPPTSPRPGGNTTVHGANGNGTAQTTGILLNRIQSPERGKHVAHTAPSLATIPEAEDSDSEGTFVSDKDGIGARKGSLSRSRSRSRSRSSSSGTRPRRASTYGQYALEYAQGAVLWPYRLSTRILVAVLPPVEKFVPKL
ncbi:hypothetical protein BD413DRAFT_522099 [Trametes elegans]|nr:hypothetical protein BD413DRAFT_522099 [Trametes elegans]